MNAKEFVKIYGWDEAKKQLENPKPVNGCAVDTTFMHELEEMVEAFEILDKYDSLVKAVNHEETLAFGLSTNTWQGIAYEERKKYQTKLANALRLLGDIHVK
jgi:hypothetical protein